MTINKRNKQKELEARSESLTGDITSVEELEDLTRLHRKKTFEAMLEGEMVDHLGYSKYAYEATLAATAVMVIAVKP